MNQPNPNPWDLVHGTEGPKVGIARAREVLARAENVDPEYIPGMAAHAAAIAAVEQAAATQLIALTNVLATLRPDDLPPAEHEALVTRIRTLTGLNRKD